MVGWVGVGVVAVSTVALERFEVDDDSAVASVGSTRAADNVEHAAAATSASPATRRMRLLMSRDYGVPPTPLGWSDGAAYCVGEIGRAHV